MSSRRPTNNSYSRSYSRRTGARTRRNMRLYKKTKQGAKCVIIRGPSVAPDCVFVKLKYRDRGTLTSTLGAIAQKVYRANSAFDPDESLGGGQPMGYDQWSAFYRRYQVVACKINVKLLSDVTNVKPTSVALTPIDDATSITGIMQGGEMPYAKKGLLPATSTRPLVLSSYLKTAKKFGYKNIEQEDDLSSLNTDNPLEQWFWCLTVGAHDGTSSTNVDYETEVCMYVRFFDRIDLGRS